MRRLEVPGPSTPTRPERAEAPAKGPGWLGRRVFLTGHTGFKGGWLTWMLARRGAQVHGYALPPPAGPALYDVARVASVLEGEHLADVRDAALLQRALAAARPEVVFHLAAQPLVRASYAQPLETFATNVMGTAHLLEAVRGCDSVRAVVVVTSDKCYRDIDASPRPCTEGDALGGHDPYSASKAAAEIVAASYAAAFTMAARGTGVATARAGNVIGGGDWSEDRLLPDLLRALDAGHAPRLRHPHAVRPWQHVLDPLAGYVRLAERLLADPVGFSGAWNFGPAEAEPVTVRQIADRFLALAGAAGLAPPAVEADAAASTEAMSDAAPHEAARLQLDSTRARQRLGWQPRLTLDDALASTWHWHHQWRSGGDACQATLRQIQVHAAAEAAASPPTQAPSPSAPLPA